METKHGGSSLLSSSTFSHGEGGGGGGGAPSSGRGRGLRHTVHFSEMDTVAMSETLPVPRLKKQSQSTLSASAPALIPISDPTALRKVATGVKKSDVSAASLVPKFGMPAFESTFAYEHHAKEYAKALDTYDFEQVLTLIEYGFPIDYADHRSETALIKAAGHEHGQGAVKLLIQYGANVDKGNNFGRTSLMKAAASGNLIAARMLVRAGADLLIRDSTQKTALDWARVAGHLSVVHFLEETIAIHIDKTRNRIDTDKLAKRLDELVAYNQRLLYIVEEGLRLKSPMEEILSVVRAATIDRDAFVSALIKLGREPRSELFYLDVEAKGFTLLTRACADGNLAAVEMLIKKKADMNRETKRGHTPLTWAATCGHTEILQTLLEAGAELDYQTKYEGRTALMHACYNDKAPAVSLLLDAIIEQALKTRHTNAEVAKHARTEAERKQRLKEDWLVSFQKSMLQTDNRGQTAEDIVQQRGHKESQALIQLALNRLEERQKKAEIARRNRTMQQCPMGCGVMVRHDDLVRHQEMHCVKRIVPCTLGCGEEMPFEARLAHEEQSCECRLVRCENVYDGCMAQVAMKDLQSHMNFHCKKRKVLCRLGCGEQMCFDVRDDHETEACRKRIVACNLSCGVHIMQELLAKHLAQECPRRLILCPLGCGIRTRAEDMDHHVNTECKLPCKWQCGAVIGPKDRRDVHEQWVCPLRIVECEFSCGIDGLREKDRPAHQNSVCPKRVLACNLGCGLKLPAEDMPRHQTGEAGDCPRRRLRCRFDMLGKRIRVCVDEGKGNHRRKGGGKGPERDEGESGGETKEGKGSVETKDGRAPRDEAKQEGETKKEAWLIPMPGIIGLPPDESEGGQGTQGEGSGGVWLSATIRDYNKVTGQHLILYENGVCQWIELKSLQYKEVGKQAWPCGKVMALNRHEHEGQACCFRKLACRHGCGQTLQARYMTEHESVHCLMRPVSCRLGCSMVMTVEQRWAHEKNECANRHVTCECGESVMLNEMEYHRRFFCGAELRRCKLGCGARVPRNSDHETKECAKRIVECRFGCGVKRMWAEEQPFHEESVCARRLLPCPLGCDARIVATEMHEHLRVCTMRPMPCPLGCGETVNARDLKRHQTIECSMRKMRCPLGCGALVPECDMEIHEESRCPNRFETCKCGRLVQKSDQKHLRNECPKRAIECPNGCGDTIRAEEESEHKRRCAFRVVQCGANCEACKRQLRSWLLSAGVKTAKLIVRNHEDDGGGGRGRETERAREKEGEKEKEGNGKEKMEKDGKEGSRKKETAAESDGENEESRETVEIVKAWRQVSCDQHGETALTWAARHGDEVLVAHIIKCIPRKDIDFETKGGENALTKACRFGHLKCAEILLDNGADINHETRRGVTPLVEAVRGGHEALVSYLIDSYVQIDYKNRHGRTALEWARQWGSRERIVEILEFNLGMQKKHCQLVIDINMGDYDAVKRLVGSGDPYQYNQIGKIRDTLAELRLKVKETQEEIEGLDVELQPLEVPLKKVQTDLETKETRAKVRLDAAQEIADRCQTLEEEMTGREVGVKRTLTHTKRSDINALQSIKYPDENMSAILRAVCETLSIPCKRVLDPRGTYEMIDDWWGTARAFLADADVLHTLISNLRASAIQKKSRERLAELMADDDGKALRYACHSLSEDGGEILAEEDDEGYIFLNTLSTWLFTVHRVIEIKDQLRPLRAEESRLRVEYNTMSLQMWNLRNEVERQMRRVGHLRNCISDGHEDIRMLKESIVSYEQKLLVAQLVAWKTRTGHTALSWAAMRGEAAIVQLLIQHGSCPNHDTGHHDLTARAIQVVVRHFLEKIKRPEWTPSLSHVFHMRDIQYAFQLRLACQKIRNYKRSCRLPLMEAVYNGDLDSIKVLLDMGARTWNRSYVYPCGCAPYPYPCHWEGIQPLTDPVTIGPVVQSLPDRKTAHGGSKGEGGGGGDGGREGGGAALTLLDVAELGVRHQAAATWLYGTGWIREGPNEQTRRFVVGLLERMKEEKEYKLSQHNKAVQVHRRAQEERELARQLGLAVNFERWQEVQQLLEQGAPIDHVNDYGHTALTMAAGQETYTTNPEGDRVLVVNVLLDHPKNRPQINRETGRRHTALTYAAKRGKLLSIEALLDHDATINHVTADGKTALIHAALSGKWDATRLLLERGADPTYQDQNGKTAAHYAIASNFVNVARMLGQFRAGNMGHARPTMGEAEVKIICSFGCGAMLHPRDVVEHEEEKCPKRIVECRLKCGIQNMWAEEVEEHEKSQCHKRGVYCRLGCGKFMLEETRDHHEQEVCQKRQVTCARCKKTMIAYSYELHQKEECMRRERNCQYCQKLCAHSDMGSHLRHDCQKVVIRCRLGCGAEFRREFQAKHEETMCPERIIECPNCEAKIRARLKISHQVNDCVVRLVKCRFAGCETRTPFEKVKEHEAQCVFREVPCPNVCGRKVAEHLLSKHLDEECVKRIVQCSLGCGFSCRAEELAHHESTECENRLLGCGNGCGKMVRASEIEVHKAEECTRRIVPCRLGCAKKLPFDERGDHELKECRKRKVYCAFGCGEILLFGKRKGHENTRCPMRFVRCPLGCKELLRAFEVEYHTENQCVRRQTSILK